MFRFQNYKYTFKLDKALIESDKDENMVAVLIIGHYFKESWGIGQERVTLVYTGNIVEFLTGQLPKAMLENEFIGEVK
ncbi:MAG: hypothetical protein LUC34_02565 [Campylobacter sp.]|nr:hypothetical protein [Campylobacter sp.]